MFDESIFNLSLLTTPIRLEINTYSQTSTMSRRKNVFLNETLKLILHTYPGFYLNHSIR